MFWRIGKTRRITCSVSFFEVLLFVCYQNDADPAPQHCPLTYFYHYWRIIDALFPHCLSTWRWIAASILKTERYSLRHYTDATTHLAPLGMAQQYCSVFNFQLVFAGFFYSSPPIAQERRLTRCVNRQCAVQRREKTYGSVSPIWSWSCAVNLYKYEVEL